MGKAYLHRSHIGRFPPVFLLFSLPKGSLSSEEIFVIFSTPFPSAILNFIRVVFGGRTHKDNLDKAINVLSYPLQSYVERCKCTKYSEIKKYGLKTENKMKSTRFINDQSAADRSLIL